MRVLYRRVLSGRLSRHAFFALAQSVLAAVLVLVTYRVAIAEVGLEHFGVWSLVVAAAVFMRLCDISGAGPLARFLAVPPDPDNPIPARAYIHTVLLTGLAANFLLGAVFWPVTSWLLPRFIEPAFLAESRDLIPWVVAVTIVTSTSFAIASALDGSHRADQRAIVMSLSYLVLMAATWALVPQLGLVGFALAQVIQHGFVIAVGWSLLNRRFPGLGWFPTDWRMSTFRNTSSYALRLNTVSAAGVMLEPLARFAFNHTGGPGMVALFDLGSRMITQLRSLIVTTAAPLTPAFAANDSFQGPVFRSLLAKSMKLAAAASVVITVVSLACAPLVSLFVLGTVSRDMLFLNAILTAGWAVFSLPIPLYYSAQALGVTRWNLVGYVVVLAVFAVSAWSFSAASVTDGTAWAMLVALLSGTAVLLFGNARLVDGAAVLTQIRMWIVSAAVCTLLLCALALELAPVLGSVG